MREDKCKYGEFNLDNEGSYTITNTSLPSSWEYIYQNKDILLRADQRGVVNAQASPPQDIMLVKRTSSDRTSRWQVWIAEEKGEFISNFGFPRNDKILKSSVTFSVESARYFSEYKNFAVKTELLVPRKGIAAVMVTTLTNTSDKPQKYSVAPVVEPYVNQAVMAPWDKPEWYLSTAVRKTPSDNIEFFTHLGNPLGDKTKRRMVSFTANCDGAVKAEIDFEKAVGCGSFDSVDGLKLDNFSYDIGELTNACEYKNETVYGYPPIYALRYEVTLAPNESKSFTQALSMQSEKYCGIYNEQESEKHEKLLLESVINDEKDKNRKFFNNLFNFRRVKTSDDMFNNYANAFLPLQMYWVASLDRGWPTGMRGVRDASNDFMGMLPFDDKWSKHVLIELFSCERTDGWLPRQISTLGVSGKHDLRAYCDGGAFALEFFYQYLSYTADKSVFFEKVGWLDSGEESSIFEHYIKALEWYLQKENIGEHGLNKIYEGDWLDAVNKAGVLGRGESVTVTAQTVINLSYAEKILAFYYDNNFSLETTQLLERYKNLKTGFKDAMNTFAFNKSGFYNSVFNDEGKWVFSDLDADGEKRIYGPANYFAITCGAADDKKIDSVLSFVKELKCESGYRLFSPAFGKIPISGVGRIASGDMPSGLWENGNVYNHGSQGFLARALAECGKGDLLKEVINYILPYSQTAHPVEQTLSAPYAVVNCYQSLPKANNRGGMPFLTGTIAIAIRAIYEWMFGIQPSMDGLEICPCLATGKIDSEVCVTLRGKKIKLLYFGEVKLNGSYTVSIDNIPQTTIRFDQANKPRVFIDEKAIKDGSVITITPKN